jgi:hypothetical protein
MHEPFSRKLHRISRMPRCVSRTVAMAIAVRCIALAERITGFTGRVAVFSGCCRAFRRMLQRVRSTMCERWRRAAETCAPRRAGVRAAVRRRAQRTARRMTRAAQPMMRLADGRTSRCTSVDIAPPAPRRVTAAAPPPTRAANAPIRQVSAPRCAARAGRCKRAAYVRARADMTVPACP